jgi:hypothetical protein
LGVPHHPLVLNQEECPCPRLDVSHHPLSSIRRSVPVQDWTFLITPPILNQEEYPCPRLDVSHHLLSSIKRSVPVQDWTFSRKSLLRASSSAPPVLNQEGCPCPRLDVPNHPLSSIRRGVPVQDWTFSHKSLLRASSSAPPYPQPRRVSLSGVLILTRSYPRLLPCFLQGPILVLDLPFFFFLRGYLLSLFFNEVISSPCF